MNTQALGPGSRIKHEQFGIGAIVKTGLNTIGITFMQHGYMELAADTPLETIEAVAARTDLISIADVEQSLTIILRKWSDIQEVVALGNKWDGGTMILKPGDNNLKSKEIPIDVFFHKIVMVRDRLRVMEQRINSSKNLSDEEKVNLQQYISRIYGSLTTFNVLFKNAEDQFKGTRS